jgi:hypothetical protein
MKITHGVVDDASDEEEDDESDVGVVEELVVSGADWLEGEGGKDSEEAPSLFRV